MKQERELTGGSKPLEPAAGIEEIKKLAEPQRVFLCVWDVEAEVNRGGFRQYFRSRSAGTVPFVAGALDTIGAPRTAGICRRAIACAYPGGLPTTAAGIVSGAESLRGETLSELEKIGAEFLAYPQSLTGLLCAYVMKHPDEFATLPEIE